MAFDYGIVIYKRVGQPCEDYPWARLDRCVSVSVYPTYKIGAGVELVYEVQILYRDDECRGKFLRLPLREWIIRVVHKGDMGVTM